MLHFVLGDKASGKSKTLYEEALHLDAQNKHVFFIVPEQNTLGVQKKLLEASPNGCLLNIEVLSFNRLAHRIFEEMGTPVGNPVDDLGKSLLLYQVARENKDKLLYYKDSYQKPGFIGRLKLFLTEMEQYVVDKDGLLKVASEEPNSVFDMKMRDLELLYNAYVARLGTTLYNSEHILDELALKLASSQLAQNSFFCFDGFSGFTPQQYGVLATLLSHAKGVSIALTVPEQEYSQIQRLSDWRQVPSGLFHEPSKTYVKLSSLASGLQIPSQTTLLPQSASYRKPTVYAERFANFEDELENALKQMLHLMRTDGYRLRDMALVMPQMEDKSHYIARRMDAYNFGYHLNTKTNLSMHPLAQLVFQSIRMIKTDFAFDPVFAFFKTGLTPLEENALYVFELEAKAINLHGFTMLDEELRRHPEWKGAEAIADAILAFKTFCAQNDQITVNDFIKALNAFFKALGLSSKLLFINSKLQELESSCTENATLASQYRRVREEYTVCLNVYQKCVSDMQAYAGSMLLSLDELYDLFTISFSQSAVGVVPSSVDSLLVADINGSRLEEVKALFVLGLSENNFPGNGSNPGLFTQKERVKLNASLEMAPDATDNIDLKYFSLYSLLGKATEFVYLSAPKATSEGKKAEPCLIWSDLESGVFSGFDSAKAWPENDLYSLAVPYMEEHGFDMPDEALKHLKRTHQNSIRAMEAGKKQKTPSDKIRPETAKSLFEAQGSSYSISKLEAYANCPFRFFLRYGLRVKMPTEPVVTALQEGNLMHTVMEKAGKLFSAMFEQQGALSTADAQQNVGQTFAQMKDEPDYAVFQSTARYRFYWDKLQQSAGESLVQLGEMLSHTKFEPSAFEWKFGGASALKLTLMDQNNQPFELEGKIDRIDVWNSSTERYVSIFDYKTGSTEFNEKDLSAGTQIQLPIYMKAACELFDPKNPGSKPQEKGHPAGYFYYHVFENEEKVKTNGRMINDPAVITKLDTSENEGGDPKPQFYKVGIKKDGNVSNTGATAVSIETLQEYENQAVQRATEAVTQIRNGEIGINPLTTTNDGSLPDACAYCDYKGNCGLDRRTEYPKRIIQKTEEEKKEAEE